MRRRMLLQQARLPSEYQEVYSLSSQSDGKQWIDTGHIITYNTRTVVEASVLSVNKGAIFAAYIDGYGVQAYFGAWRTFGRNSRNVASAVANKRTHFELYRNDITIDGQTYTSTIDMTFPSMVGIPLFTRRYNGGSAGDGFNVTIYYCDIYENEVLSMSLVPCYRKSDNEIGMYDLVNGVFYTNQGTGTFTKGADV